jgi:hypothetical protein
MNSVAALVGNFTNHVYTGAAERRAIIKTIQTLFTKL